MSRTAADSVPTQTNKRPLPFERRTCARAVWVARLTITSHGIVPQEPVAPLAQVDTTRCFTESHIKPCDKTEVQGGKLQIYD